MQTSQEHFTTIVYAKFGGQTEWIMGNWKIENGPFARYLLPLFQNESSRKTFHMKFSLTRSHDREPIRSKRIFIWIVSHGDSFRQWGKKQLGNVLLHLPLSNVIKHKGLRVILVPRAHDPSGLWRGSRALGWSNTGSPRFTDFPSNLANLVGWEYETNTLRMLRESGPARALDPCRRPEGSWALGTRMFEG